MSTDVATNHSDSNDVARAPVRSSTVVSIVNVTGSWDNVSSVTTLFGDRPWKLNATVHLVGPDWSLVREQLQWTWVVHTYGFACVFFMLAFYTFFSILNLRAQLSSRPFMSTINVFLCLLGSSRALAFLIDPYNSKGIMPEAIGAILWDLAFPCLVSAFTLVQLAFLQLTQLKLGPPKLRSKSFLSVIISIHFCFTIATNILWSFHDDLKVLCYISQTVFSCWGIFVCCNFLYGGWRTMQLLKLVPPLLFPRSDSTSAGYENKGILQLGILAKCNNLAAVTATVAAPAMVMPPKIRITDDEEQTYSFISDGSHSSNPNIELLSHSRMGNSPEKINVSRDIEDLDDRVLERTRMLDDSDEVQEDINKALKCNGQGRTINGRSPRRVRISSVPHIMQNGSPYKSSNCSKHNEAGEDQLEMNIFSNVNKWYKKKKIPDQTLTSVLSHIAYVDQAMDDFKFDSHRLKPTRRSQIQKVLRATCLTASLGALVCLLQLGGIFGPYGIWASDEPPSPWPWFVYQTLFRLTEFAMGILIANITKQPVNRHHFPYSYHLNHREALCY